MATSDPAGEVAFENEDDPKIRRYRFAQRTAEFLICGECGVFVAALTETGAGRRAVINARVLDGIALNFSAIAHASFTRARFAGWSIRRRFSSTGPVTIYARA